MKKEIISYNGNQVNDEIPICEFLAGEIIKLLPEAEYKIWHAHPVWFLNGNPIVGYSKLKGGIRLLFWSGQSFDENELIATGKFKAAEKRFEHITQINTEALHRWLEKSKIIQWDYKNIVKLKGTLNRLM